MAYLNVEHLLMFAKSPVSGVGRSIARRQRFDSKGNQQMKESNGKVSNPGDEQDTIQM